MNATVETAQSETAKPENPAPEHPASPQKLLNRNFVLLWQGQFVSRLGAQLTAVALSFWIKHATGSAALLGVIQMVATLPTILLGPIGGAYADRYSRRSILMVGDIARGVLILLLSIFMFMMPEATDAILVWLFVVMLVNGVVFAFFNPAISAAIPDLVADQHIGGANSMAQVSVQLSLFLGQGLGGLLYRVAGAPALFLFNGAAYLFSAFSVFLITIPQVTKKKASDWRRQLREFKEDTVEGFHYAWNTAGLRELLVLSALAAFFSTPVIVLLPFYVEDFLGVAPDWYGFILAGYGLGAMIGYGLAGALKFKGQGRGLAVTLCIVLESSGYALLGLTRQPYIALALAFLGGISSGFTMVSITTIMQLRTPADMRGRVFGLLGTISGSLAPLAMGLAGVVADLVNQNIPLIYVVSGVVMGVLSVVMASKRAFREFLSYEMPDVAEEPETLIEAEAAP